MRSELGTSGKAIWDAYGADKLDAGHRALILEFARCADTADRLNALAMGRQDRWAMLVFDDMGEVHLGVDKLLDQARSNQTVLKSLHAEVRAAGIKATAPETKAKDEEPEDMLAKLRKEKDERERKLG